jgi:PadR family transcriptional regulator PadR
LLDIYGWYSIICKTRQRCFNKLKKGTSMKFESQLLKGIAPVVVLEILSRGQMYGYELSEAIEQKSEQVLTLGKGTLYPLLYNLEARKLIRGKWETADSGRKRRYYSITSRGKAQLAEQKQQLKELTAGLKQVFGGTLATA